MAAGSATRLSGANSGVVNSLKDATMITIHLEYTSTDVTHEVDVSPITTILGMTAFRVGAANTSNAGYLSISETYTSAGIAVDPDQEVTIVRQAVTSTAPPAAEEFMVNIWGLDL